MFRELTEEEITFVSGGQRVYQGQGGTYYYDSGNRTFSGGWVTFLYGSPGSAGWGSEQQVPPPDPPDCQVTTINSEDSNIYGIESAISLAAEDVIHKAGNLFASTSYSFGGLTISAGDIFRSLSLLDIDIKSPGWTEPSTGSPSSLHYNNGNPQAYATGLFLQGHAAYGLTGLAFYLIHEALHGTAAGFAFSSSQTPIANEIAINEIALKVMADLGYAIDRSYPGPNINQPDANNNLVTAVRTVGSGALAGAQTIC